MNTIRSVLHSRSCEDLVQLVSRATELVVLHRCMHVMLGHVLAAEALPVMRQVLAADVHQPLFQVSQRN